MRQELLHPSTNLVQQNVRHSPTLCFYSSNICLTVMTMPFSAFPSLGNAAQESSVLHFVDFRTVLPIFI